MFHKRSVYPFPVTQIFNLYHAKFYLMLVVCREGFDGFFKYCSFEVTAKKPKSFSCQTNRICKKYFHRQHILHEYFPSSMLKINLCTSRRTQLQQSLEMSVSLIFSFCIDILRRWQHFFSHVTTFPYLSRLNQYLAENRVLLISIIEPSPNSNPLNISSLSAIVFYLPLHNFWEKWVWKI